MTHLALRYDGLDQVNRGFTLDQALAALEGRNRQRLQNSITRITGFEQTIRQHLSGLPAGGWYLTRAHLEAARAIRHPSQAGRKDLPSEAVCRRVTAEALAGRKTPLQRMEGLMQLPGVGAAVASLLLAMVFPETFATIDRRAYRQLYRTQAAETSFTVAEYLKYNRDLTAYAQMLGLAPHRLEQTLFAFDFCMNEAAASHVTAPPGPAARSFIRLADKTTTLTRQLESRWRDVGRAYGRMPRG